MNLTVLIVLAVIGCGLLIVACLIAAVLFVCDGRTDVIRRRLTVLLCQYLERR